MLVVPFGAWGHHDANVSLSVPSGSSVDVSWTGVGKYASVCDSMVHGTSKYTATV